MATSLRLALAGQSLIKHELRNVADPDVEALRALLRGCDAAFTNFEGTITVPGAWATKESFTHDSPEAVFDTLADFGFNLLGLANNHAFDLGPPGVQATCAAARRRGLAAAGCGDDLAAAGSAVFHDTPHGRIALVAMDASSLPEYAYARDPSERLPARPGLNPLRIRRGVKLGMSDYQHLHDLSTGLGHERRKQERLRKGYPQRTESDGFDFYGAWLRPGVQAEEAFEADADDLRRNLGVVTAAANEADLVLVSLHQHHWAPDWQSTPHWLQAVGHACIDAGAHVFAAHGVPMGLGMQWYRDRPLFFGLGNFIFHTFRQARYVEQAVWESLVPVCSLDAAGLQVELAAIAIDVDQRQWPRLLSGDAADALFQRADLLCRPLGARVCRSEAGALARLEPLYAGADRTRRG